MARNKRDIYLEIEDGKCDQLISGSRDRSNGRKLLLAAVKDENISKLKKLLCQGIDPDFKCSQGETLVQTVVKMKPSEETLSMLELLVYFGAHLEQCDRFGQTAVHLAAASPATDQMRILLEAGCLVNRQDNAGRTSLMVACDSGGDNSLVMIQMLLDWQCNVGCVDQDGYSALHYTCQNKHQTAATRNEIILSLLYAGLSSTLTDHAGRMAVCYELDRLMTFNLELESSDQYEPVRSLVRGGTHYSQLRGTDQSWLRFSVATQVDRLARLFDLTHYCLRWKTLRHFKHVLRSQDHQGETHQRLVDCVTRCVRSPRSLMCCSRAVVRDCLGGWVFSKYEALPIPVPLQQYLIFNG